MESRVFIGSSSEHLDVANAIERNLSSDFVTRVWTDAFPAGEFFLESLVKTLEWADFGVFVFASDDAARIRSEDSRIVRDNVLFEAGMFVGGLGRDRTFIVCPVAEKVHFASDLAGLEAKVSADPLDHQARIDLAMACAARGAKDQAIDHLLEAFRRDRNWNEQAARKQLLQLFEAWGPKDPHTLEGRRRLSSMLFA